jgi:hypothetical protein
VSAVGILVVSSECFCMTFYGVPEKVKKKIFKVSEIQDAGDANKKYPNDQFRNLVVVNLRKKRI